jgi:hypothetical protein
MCNRSSKCCICWWQKPIIFAFAIGCWSYFIITHMIPTCGQNKCFG